MVASPKTVTEWRNRGPLEQENEEGFARSLDQLDTFISDSS